MPRRLSVPGADELVRPTSEPAPVQPEPEPETTAPTAARRTPARRKAVIPPFEEALPPATRQRAAAKAALVPAPADVAPTPEAEPTPAENEAPRGTKSRKPASGRVRHDEKITVYVSTQELIALETGRLALRGDHGLAVDRGRLVRESIAIVMADLAAHGADSELVRRLNGQ